MNKLTGKNFQIKKLGSQFKLNTNYILKRQLSLFNYSTENKMELKKNNLNEFRKNFRKKTHKKIIMRKKLNLRVIQKEVLKLKMIYHFQMMSIKLIFLRVLCLNPQLINMKIKLIKIIQIL